jgi:hypothetical protein
VVIWAPRGNTLTTETNMFPLYDAHTHTPVVYVTRCWEYRCNPMSYHTHRRYMVTLSISSICIETFWYTDPLQIVVSKIFTVKHNYLCTLLFTFTDIFLFNWSCAQTSHIIILYIFNLLIVSMECMMSTKSRTGVLLLVGIEWVRLPVACKFFSGNISQCSTEFLVSVRKFATFR